MAPARTYLVDSGLMQPKISGHGCLGMAFPENEGPNLLDGFLGKRGFLARVPIAPRNSALRHHIGHVVKASAEKKMIRVDTGRRVASMENTEPNGNVAVRKNPRDPVGHNVASLEPHLTVA